MDAAPRHAAHAARRALTQFTDEPCKRGSLTQHVAQEYAGGNWHRFAARATGRFELKKRRDLPRRNGPLRSAGGRVATVCVEPQDAAPDQFADHARPDVRAQAEQALGLRPCQPKTGHFAEFGRHSRNQPFT